MPAFEQAVIAVNPREAKTVMVPAEKAFGPYHEELIETIDRNQFPVDLEPEVGPRLNLS